MKLKIDGQELLVPKSIESAQMRQAGLMLLEKYQKIEGPLRMAAKAVSRAVLQQMERKYGVEIRPPKGADPNLHLMNLFLSIVAKGLEHVEVTIDTDSTATNTVSNLNLNLQGEGESR